ncbi:orphan sodium- and chloride-dependent neurotransmitter transporter NTT5-like isoform X5 [Canis lupus baileyi]|uniref:Transporter n=1 Tax=Canis lupus familiaris TaxID=9615 RepID=A0A8P0TK09_CANLF|nr:sodium-dependent neutral amino acid transporter SLC6A17-like isoform X5 [Canis lupus familiaris]XP_038512292.1 sodium-dependent neutral amino acid transporter SLC6A17-like isoform X5 [Canis lupus familiaris]XP_048949741.1 sodium-dependent neutral amino acid transporter SLC6A17-like isoform X5 [Canis lupus dingo]
MESLEELSEEEAPKETKTSSSLPRKLTVKEILATKTQNYFAQTKKTKKTLMQVAFTIGLGSIWRFPYLCHRNGGGNFILMYFFMLLLFGIPLLYMEMIMGHWLRMDNIRVWKQLVPWLGGIGYASILMLIFTVFLPYILLFCFLIRGLFLEGATASLRHMVTTEFSSWASLDLWRQAGGHVLYSLGLGMGITISFSSYKVGEDNYIQVASLVALVNLVTSLLATSIIFIVLGFWTSTSGHSCVEKSILKLKNLIKRGMLPQDAKPPEDMLYLTTLDYLDWISKLPQYLQYQVIHFSPSCSIKMQKEKFMEGPGLAFVAFSQVISLFPGASFWAILFFLALVIMGLSTSIQILEGIVSPLQNSISTFRRYPKLLSVLICLGGFLGSLVFTSHAGSYIMSLFDDYLIPLTLVIIVTFQNVALACIYGARRVREEIFSDLGRLLWSFFIVLWCYVTLPGLLALTTIYFMQLYQMVPPYYIAWNSSMSQEVKQPYLQSTLGWVTFLSILTLLPIPVHPLYHWWYLQDHIASDPLEKLQPKKMPSVPPKPLQWPKHHLGKSQEKNSESSSKQLSLLLGRGLNLNLPPWQCSLPLSRSSQSSSWLSLPVITSLTSSFSRRSVSLPISRQVSPASVAVDNSELHTETKEEKQDENSVQ